MPLVYVKPTDPENRSKLLDALRRLNPEDADVLETTDDPDALGLRFDGPMPNQAAVERAGQIVRGASEIAGERLDAISSIEAD